MPDQITIRMTSVKETKNTFQFVDAPSEGEENGLTLGTLYVPKALLKALGAKGDINVTITKAT